jgi:hypothetical protein
MSQQNNAMNTFLTLGILGAAVYLAWEWLQSACASGGSLYGNSMCSMFGITPAAATSSSTAPAVTATITPGATTAQISVTGPPNAAVTMAGETGYSNVGYTNSGGQLTFTVNLPPASVLATISVAGGGNTAQVTVPNPAQPTTLPTGQPLSSIFPTTGTSLQTLVQAQTNGNTFYIQQGNQLDAYQWDTLMNAVGGPSVNIGQIFFPNGLNAGTPNGPGLSSQGLPLMTLQQFMNALQNAGVTGLSGLGASRVPMFLVHRRGWA